MKRSSGTPHVYALNGTQILTETIGNKLLVYLYDESGAPIGMQYRTTSYAAGQYDTYFFEKNLQGDIIAVYTENGTKIGSYTYDAWGNCTYVYTVGATSAQKQIISTLNPFRYRGYYYDTETGLYYLQTRYYSPQLGRFLNADAYVNANGDIIGFNMFAYCGNNPVMNVDPEGTIGVLGWIIIIAIAAIAINHCVTGVEILVANANVKDEYTIEETKKAIQEITNDKVIFNDSCVEIKESRNIHSRYKRIKISMMLKNTLNENKEKITERSIYSLSSEWAGHNIASLFGIMSDQTDDVNLDWKFSNNAWYTKWGTVGLGILGAL